jgi:hypothetical protein
MLKDETAKSTKSRKGFFCFPLRDFVDFAVSICYPALPHGIRLDCFTAFAMKHAFVFQHIMRGKSSFGSYPRLASVKKSVM